jgi:nitrate reductase gamma subunit
VIVALGAALVTLVVAGGAALALRRDAFSAVAAAGTRDPIVAIALAWAAGGAGATAVPLVSAAILGIVAAASVLRRR